MKQNIGASQSERSDISMWISNFTVLVYCEIGSKHRWFWSQFFCIHFRVQDTSVASSQGVTWKIQTPVLFSSPEWTDIRAVTSLSRCSIVCPTQISGVLWLEKVTGIFFRISRKWQDSSWKSLNAFYQTVICIGVAGPNQHGWVPNLPLDNI